MGTSIEKLQNKLPQYKIKLINYQCAWEKFHYRKITHIIEGTPLLPNFLLLYAKPIKHWSLVNKKHEVKRRKMAAWFQEINNSTSVTAEIEFEREPLLSIKHLKNSRKSVGPEIWFDDGLWTVFISEMGRDSWSPILY